MIQANVEKIWRENLGIHSKRAYSGHLFLIQWEYEYIDTAVITNSKTKAEIPTSPHPSPDTLSL